MAGLARTGRTSRAIAAGAGSIVAALLLACCPVAAAAPCASEDLETHVSGVGECLLMRRYGPTTQPAALVVWLHGDVTSGGPADYHQAVARQAAEDLAAARVLSVALVRPGYPDGSGASSSVDVRQGGRSDHYTKENIGEVGGAIERLRERYRPDRVIVVGHSGGAATAAVLLGTKPRLADAAVLVACPCDLVAWRAGRRAWTRSENPIAWAARTSPPVRVIALTGTADDDTPPALAQAYVEALRRRGVDAAFEPVPGASHNGAFRAPEVGAAIRRLLMP